MGQGDRSIDSLDNIIKIKILGPVPRFAKVLTQRGTDPFFDLCYHCL